VRERERENFHLLNKQKEKNQLVYSKNHWNDERNGVTGDWCLDREIAIAPATLEKKR
jgi:hypothetical protein